MKQQIGVRVDSKLWSQFKTLCSQAHLRPSEAIEAFVKTCLSYKSVTEALRVLEGLNASEKTANEIKLRKELSELEAYLIYDKKHEEVENYSDVAGCIEKIAKLLPKIMNQHLVSEAEAKINEALAYYRRIFEKAETPPKDVIIF